MKSKVLGAGPPDPLPDEMMRRWGGGCSHSLIYAGLAVKRR